MFMSSWFHWRLTRPYKGRARLGCEQLEDRSVPASYTAATVPDLIADINAANALGGPNTITLAQGKTFTLTADFFTLGRGADGLPRITANDNLTIQGNGDTIMRSATAPAFRLFDIDSGATLTLENAMLKGGLTFTGGAIYNEGALTLRSVTVTGNSAVGTGYTLEGNDYSPYLPVVGCDGLGGGIYSGHGASLALEAGTVISNNSAVGAAVPNHSISNNKAVYYGGSGYGGGVYVDGDGSATLSGVTLSNNTARGGDAGDYGGAAEGGALFAQGYDYSLVPATVTLSNCILTSNAAVGGKAKNPGPAFGGAVFLSNGATATMTSDTFSSNSAVGGAYLVTGAAGGAVYVDVRSTATLRQCTISGNSAQTSNGSKGIAEGGGLFIHSGANAVYLDVFTVSHITGNTPDDIYGPYTPI